MPIKTWLPTTSSTWNTADNWSPSGVPAAGDDVFFTTDIASNLAGVVTASTTNIQPGSIRFADSGVTFFPWQLTGSSTFITFGTGTTIFVDNAPAYIWNVISGTSQLIVSASSYNNFLALSGTSANTYTGGTRIINGALRIRSDTSLGQTPAVLDPSNIILDNSGSLNLPAATSFVLSGTRGIFLSGTGILSQSNTGGSFALHLLSPVTGTGKLILNNYEADTSTAGWAIGISLTGSNSALNNEGGLTISHNWSGSLISSGSRNLGTGPIEFRYKGGYGSSGGHALFRFYSNPSRLDDTIVNDISFTNPRAVVMNTTNRVLFDTIGTYAAPQIYRYTGRISTPATGSYPYVIGNHVSTHGGNPLNIILSGDNSNFYGIILPGAAGPVSVTFVGSQSLPHPTALIRSTGIANSTGTLAANLTFSGTMTVSNPLEPSYGTGPNLKLVVPSENVITHTGRLGLTGSLTRYGSAWQAARWTGPGEWISSGTIAGAGSIVIESGSRLTLATSGNTFTGYITASNAVLTIGAGGGDTSFGAVPGSSFQQIQLLNSTLAVSSSFALSDNRVIALSGSNIIDVPAGINLTIGTATSSISSITTKQGGGTVAIYRAFMPFGITSGIDVILSAARVDSDFGSITTASLQDGRGISAMASFVASVGRDLILNGVSVLDATTGNTLTWPNLITGTGGLRKTGGGVVVLSGSNNTYNGSTFVSTGTLRVLNQSQLGSNPRLAIENGTIFISTGTIDTSILSSSLNGRILAPLSGTTRIDIVPNSISSFLYINGVNTSTGGNRVNSNGTSTSAAGFRYVNSSSIGSGPLIFDVESFRFGYHSFGDDSNNLSFTVPNVIDLGNTSAVNNSAVLSLQNSAGVETVTYNGDFVSGTSAQTLVLLSPNNNVNTTHTINSNMSQMTASAIILGYGTTQKYVFGPNSQLPSVSNVPTITSWGSIGTSTIGFNKTMTVPQRMRMTAAVSRSLEITTGNSITHSNVLEVTGALYITGAYTNNSLIDVANDSLVSFNRFDGTTTELQNSGLNIGNNSSIGIGTGYRLGDLSTYPRPVNSKIHLLGGYLSSSDAISLDSVVLSSGTIAQRLIDGSTNTSLTKVGPGALNIATGNTFTGLVNILGGTIVATSDDSFGAVPASPTRQIQMISSSITVPTSFALNPNRLIGATGSIIFDITSGSSLTLPLTSSFAYEFGGSTMLLKVLNSGSLSINNPITVISGSSTQFDIQAPITGSGLLVLQGGVYTGSLVAWDTFVWLTGSNSSIKVSDGIRINYAQGGWLLISGSRSISSAPVDFRNIGLVTAGAQGGLSFYEDPTTQVHTLGRISWTGASGTGIKYLSLLDTDSNFRQSQTHIYNDSITTQPTNTSDVRIAWNNPTIGKDALLTVRLLGDNSGLYGRIFPTYQNSAVHFVGSQSLPNSSSQIVGNNIATTTTASNAANWIFSGSMTIPNGLETSNNSTGVGTKLNVAAGSIVTATGRHGLTGSLLRQGSGANLAWRATSFVGPGEWIQSGTINGVGSLVVEPGSRLTLVNNSNAFTGYISASSATITITSGANSGVFGGTGTLATKLHLLNSTFSISSSIDLNSNHVLAVTGSSTIDIVSGANLNIPDLRWGSYSSANLNNPANLLNIVGGGTVNAPNVRILPYRMWPTYPTPPSSFPNAVTRSVSTDLDWGNAPVSLDFTSAQLKSGEVIEINGSTFILNQNRGIFLSGTATLSSSNVGNASFDVRGPVTGSGQLIFNGYLPSGSANTATTIVSFTGSNSNVLNSGGIRIDSTADTQLYSSGASNIGSASIEFRNKGSLTSGATTLYFLQDPSRQIHTMSGDISWTGANTSTKTLSRVPAEITQPQTHIYSGRISTQPTNTSYVRFGWNDSSDAIIVKLTGDNSNLRGIVAPSQVGRASLHFVGQQSLPHSSTLIAGDFDQYNSSSDDGNIVFSGSMTVPNRLETSNGGTLGAKLNVPAGDTVIATGRHGITGSLFRWFAGTSPGWNATSFTGAGVWIQSGTVAGAGSLVLEPNSRLTLATNANTFTGYISASNATLTIGPGGGDASFGAVPGVAFSQIQLTRDARIIHSSSYTLNSNRRTGITGSGIFDVASGQTLTYAGVISGTGSFRKDGAGTLMLSGTNTFTSGVFINSGTLRISTIAALGTTPATINSSSIVFNNSGTLILPSNEAIHTISGTNGIFLSGAGVFSSSYYGGTTFHVLSPVSGAGQLTFSSFDDSLLSNGIDVYLTGTNSSTTNGIGLRLSSKTFGTMYSRGNNIGSSSLEFNTKTGGTGGAYLAFVQDGALQVHTMSGDISWTGALGAAGLNDKALSLMAGNVTQAQTHIYSGKLATLATNTSNVYIGHNVNLPGAFGTGRDQLLRVRLTGDNSGLYGVIFPAYSGSSVVEFVGSQSLPNSSATLRAFHDSTTSTGSIAANWIFSGSMTIPNVITSSQGTNFIGAKMNVDSNSTVTATGRHTLSGALIRRGSGANLAWEALSFVGPGEWIQQGVVTGSGAIVIEPGSRLTIANNANLFSGPVSASNGAVLTMGVGSNSGSFGVNPTSAAVKLHLLNSTLAVSNSFSMFSNHAVASTGSNMFDITSGSTLTIPNIRYASLGSYVSSPRNTLTRLGGGTLSTNKLPYHMWSAYPTPPAGFIALTRSVASDLDFGDAPVSLDPTNVQLKPNEVIDTSDSASVVFSSNRGIFLSGTATLSSSLSSAPTFHILGPVTGSGQLIFDNSIVSGSNIAMSVTVFLTGSNSRVSNSGGIRLDSTNFFTLHTSGSRTIGSTSIEYRNKGTVSSAGTTALNFYQDPSTQIHTMSGDISWTGATGTGQKVLSTTAGTVTQPQTHVYTGRISTQATNTSNFIFANNSTAVGADQLLTVRLSGDNSGVIGSVRPGAGYSSVHFVGSQSLPSPLAQMIGNHTTAATASNGGNWVFSGSMTVLNPMETSNNSTGLGAKLNVRTGDTVIATGRHGLTGSLTRYGSGANLAWGATSFVGPGEWIQSGTLVGAGSLVVEPQSRLTIANGSNTFTGFITASNAVITIASGGSDNSFGATPGATTHAVQLVNSATLAFSSSFALNANRWVAITGSAAFDIAPAQTVTHQGSIVQGLADSSFRKDGTGTLILSGTNTFTGGTRISAGVLDAARVNAIASGTVTVASGATLRASNVSSSTVLVLNSSLVLSGGAITIG